MTGQEQGFTNGYKAFIPEVWSQKLNATLDKSSVMLQCVNRNWEGEISAAGDKVNIISPAEVAVSTLSGAAISYAELQPTSQNLVIDQRKYFAFKINDVAKAQANQDIMEAHLGNAKKAIETAQEQYLLGLHVDAPATNVLGGADAVVLTTANIYAQFVSLAKLLKNSNAVSAGQKPWVIINPDIEAVLLQTSEFTQSAQVGADTLREGSIGRIAGMDVMVSTNLAATGAVINVLAGTNDAVTFASQLTQVETIRDQGSFADIVRGLYLYGAKTVVPEALAKLVCKLA